MWLALMCLMVLSGQCLPLDPRQAAKDREKEMEDRLRERMQGLPKIPEFPGADREEYKRYWEEAVKSNPSKQDEGGIPGEELRVGFWSVCSARLCASLDLPTEGCLV